MLHRCPEDDSFPLKYRSRAELIGLMVMHVLWAGVVAGFIGWQIINGTIRPLPGREWVLALLGLIPLFFIGLLLAGAIACWQLICRCGVLAVLPIHRSRLLFFPFRPTGSGFRRSGRARPP